MFDRHVGDGMPGLGIPRPATRGYQRADGYRTIAIS
jgi:hypothetical protein